MTTRSAHVPGQTAVGKAGEPAREVLEHQRVVQDRVVRALPLARAIARRYFSHESTRDEDLVQVAYVGLVKSAHRFDADRGVPFDAFAAPTIAGELKRHLRDHGWFVRPPRGVQDLRRRVVQAQSRLAQEFGARPAVADLALDLGVGEHEVREALGCESHLRPWSLDAPAGDGDATLGDLVPEAGSALERVEAAGQLWSALGELSPRERLVVRLRFFEDCTQQDIGDRLGVSQMQVSRILARSLARMRTHLEAGDGRDAA